MYEYTIEEGDNGPLFYFTTSNNLHYEISLEQRATTNATVRPLYEIDITCVETERPPEDPITGVTINDMLGNYLIDHPESVISFICDNDDGRAAARLRRFVEWYSLSPFEEITMDTWEHEVDEIRTTYRMGVLYNNTSYSSSDIADSIEIELGTLDQTKF